MKLKSASIFEILERITVKVELFLTVYVKCNIIGGNSVSHREEKLFIFGHYGKIAGLDEKGLVVEDNALLVALYGDILYAFVNKLVGVVCRLIV